MQQSCQNGDTINMESQALDIIQDKTLSHEETFKALTTIFFDPRADKEERRWAASYIQGATKAVLND